MLKTLALITLGLVIFLAVVAIFISSGVLMARMWQIVAVSAAALVSAFIITIISPHRVKETIPVIVISGTILYLRQGLRHFMDPIPWLILLILLLGAAFGIIGVWLGKTVRSS